MTFSVVGRDGDSWGVTVASRFLAAGAVVPGARAGLGAIATQSFVNLRYLPDGFALLEQGLTATATLAALTAGDDLRASRQAGVVDRAGGSASFTGPDCLPWAGGTTGPDFCVQGNCLTGPEVVEAMAASFSATTGPLSRRLLGALTAGDAAGGDRRGRQSAALLVVTPGGGYAGGSDVLVDLRVDDHPQPVSELARLLDLHDLYFGRPSPDDLLALDGPLAGEVDDLLRALDHAGPEPLSDRLLGWMGWENYEERHVPGSIDRTVLTKLREAVRPAGAA